MHANSIFNHHDQIKRGESSSFKNNILIETWELEVTAIGKAAVRPPA